MHTFEIIRSAGFNGVTHDALLLQGADETHINRLVDAGIVRVRIDTLANPRGLRVTRYYVEVEP